MLEYENGDLLSGKYKFICHQTNCRGVMGAGLAKQIADKYPIVANRNRYYCRLNIEKLGTILGNNVEDMTIINLYAQDGYGRDQQYTDYAAFKQCLERLACDLEYEETDTVAFPYGIGCGLAGGDWNIIEQLLIEFSEQIRQKVIIVKRESLF